MSIRTSILATTFTLLALSSCALMQREQDPYAGLRPSERRIAMAIDRRDLVLGMTRQHVKEVWGSPYDVETAGRSEGNERWTYMGRLLNPAFKGMGGEERTVYFEEGRVIGWDKN